jgi:hypothetical protein
MVADVLIDLHRTERWRARSLNRPARVDRKRHRRSSLGSRLARRVDMSRRAFVQIVVVWGMSLTIILGISLVVRWIG